MSGAEVESVRAEAGYVGYEMWIRDLETRVGTIVGASGCFYGSRRCVHSEPLPAGLSWDFAAALKARLQGYRSVSVPEAICVVPRAAKIQTELTRKARTMARGLATLFYFRALMNPFEYGGFALMLISHKLLRWLPYLLAPLAYFALCVLAINSLTARVLFVLATAGLLAGIVAMRRSKSGSSNPFAIPASSSRFFRPGFSRGVSALRQTQLATWDPTPRPEVQTP